MRNLDKSKCTLVCAPFMCKCRCYSGYHMTYSHAQLSVVQEILHRIEAGEPV